MKYWELKDIGAERLRSHLITPDWRSRLDLCWDTDLVGEQNGYTRIGIHGQVEGAHRVSWMLYHAQDIPEGMVVRHMCHNRRCINPYHLALGTHQDNMNDMVEAGRSLCGEINPNTDLTTEQLFVILTSIYQYQFQSMLDVANYYGISHSSVQRILNGVVRTAETSLFCNQVGVALPELKSRCMSLHSNSKLTQQDVFYLKCELAKDSSLARRRELMDRFALSARAMRELAQGITYS